jgi:hypothetical protein
MAFFERAHTVSLAPQTTTYCGDGGCWKVKKLRSVNVLVQLEMVLRSKVLAFRDPCPFLMEEAATTKSFPYRNLATRATSKMFSYNFSI